ncbi:hypothetical protein HPP92_005019 [Vanilla planifolia]|uniref:Uncharacterized protein n=1 Tax=Vanilla planifolia TaxID=51239 RepID=A0A835RT89_VANPL|nr:hypothetical protein HPP92_005358 [Vanilla planifolia]KAG0494025.1 hypothetical protein HPP92_005019 [Vanilla planifolia]
MQGVMIAGSNTTAAVVVVSVDDALNAAELLDVARDGDGTVVVEAVHLLGLLEEPHEERVCEVTQGNHKALLLLFLLSHPYHQLTLGRQFSSFRCSSFHRFGDEKPKGGSGDAEK